MFAGRVVRFFGVRCYCNARYGWCARVCRCGRAVVVERPEHRLPTNRCSRGFFCNSPESRSTTHGTSFRLDIPKRKLRSVGCDDTKPTTTKLCSCVLKPMSILHLTPVRHRFERGLESHSKQANSKTFFEPGRYRLARNTENTLQATQRSALVISSQNLFFA